MYLLIWKCILYLSLIYGAHSDNRKAIAYLRSENVNGVITFTEIESGLEISGVITGLDEGKYGFHIHEIGDISTCLAAGAHFNPDDNNHGGPDHDERHVGDLGNIEFSSDGREAVLNFTDGIISLRGRNNILGRTLVLHEGEDDLGLGDNADSLLTGNAGARVACAVIGILEPTTPWNSASLSKPWNQLLLLLVCYIVLKHKLS